MNLLSKKTKDERRAYWEKRILEWEESGLSQTAFCVQKDIKYANFARWRRRVKSDNQKSSATPTLLPIKIRQAVEFSSERSTFIQITLSKGGRIDLPIDISAEQLRVVVSSL